MSFTYEIPHGDLPRSESGLYSSSERSYNDWQYGDEASLYSIAEDSREYGSDVFSVAGTDAVPDVPTLAVQSDIQRVDKDLKEEEEIDGSSHSAIGNLYHRLQYSKMMKFGLTGLLLLVVVLAIVIGIRASNSEPSTVPGSLEVGAETPEDAPVALPIGTPPPYPVSSPTTSSPTQSPSTQENDPSSTASPTHSVAYKLATSFVTDALKNCADAELFQDLTSPQGQIFQKLALELFEETTVDTDGFIYYPLNFGDAFIQEKFALKMLYEATNGNDWDNNMNWKTENDPCAGWYGVQNCRPRREGSCGVIEIDLGTSTSRCS